MVYVYLSRFEDVVVGSAKVCVTGKRNCSVLFFFFLFSLLVVLLCFGRVDRLVDRLRGRVYKWDYLC